MNELDILELQEAEDFMVTESVREAVAEDEGETFQEFRISNLEQASWALRKLSAIKAKNMEIDNVARAEIERVTDWQKNETKKLEKQRQFFERLLEEFHRSRIAQNPKEKTISTPYGKMQIKKIPPKWEYDDNKLLQWLKKNKPELVRIKEEPNKQGLKKAVKVSGSKAIDPDTGEIVEGIAIQPEMDKFYVEVE